MHMWLTVGLAALAGVFGNIGVTALVLAVADEPQSKPRPPRGKYVPHPIALGV